MAASKDAEDLIKVFINGEEYLMTQDIYNQMTDDPSFAATVYNDLSKNEKHEKSKDEKVADSDKACDQACTDKSIPKVWTQAETDLLFSLRYEKDDEFNKSKTHSSLWNGISNEMKKSGYSVTGVQCQNKWKSLKRMYMETVDHNSKTGESPKSCKYFDELGQLFGNKASTRPEFTIHSGRKSPSPSCSASSSGSSRDKKDESGSDNDISESCPVPPKKKKVSGREKRKSSSVLDFLKSYTEKQDKDREAYQQSLKEQNEERLARFDRLLDILEKKTSVCNSSVQDGEK